MLRGNASGEKRRDEMQKVGFLGLGIMGRGMVARLINAGMDVVVWNRTAERCQPFVEMGATQASSAAEVAATCGVTYAIVSDPAASEALCFGPQGVLEGIKEGHGYVDMSTIDVETSQRVGEAISARGARYLEAPVSGSKKPAEDGTLIILAAGDESLFEEARPGFDAMGKMSLYLGETGQGARMKLVVNMIMGAMMTAFNEGMVLAETAGLSTDDLLQVLDNGAMSNPMFRGKGPNIQKQSFAPAFPLKHMQKDMRLALLLGDQCGVGMPTIAAANETMKRAKGMGLSDNDFSAVHMAVRNDKK
jgi:3-hydroxyisobutyrate dehydrogenase-like beta-hydroxyacid dehydrogenase